jgi:hypothetical protein
MDGLAAFLVAGCTQISYSKNETAGCFLRGNRGTIFEQASKIFGVNMQLRVLANGNTWCSGI